MALRCEPLMRVSTEKQKAKGKSLKTQKEQIIQYIHSMDGTIPDHCWRYMGQEHATPNQERALLDRMCNGGRPHAAGSNSSRLRST